MKNALFTASFAALSLTASAWAEEDHEHEEHGHLDLSPTIVDGQIISNGFSDEDAEFVAGESVFGLEFGEIPSQPTFVGDPGFNIRSESGFAEGSQVGFRFGKPLLFWDGSAEPAFTTPVDAETILLSFGAGSSTVSGSTGSLPDFFFGPAADDSGAMHFHINSLLTNAGSSPAAGIYLLEAQIIDTAGNTPSDPVFLVYNLGLDEELHEESLEYIEANLVPEPASAMLVAAGTTLLVRRRRSARQGTL